MSRVEPTWGTTETGRRDERTDASHVSDTPDASAPPDQFDRFGASGEARFPESPTNIRFDIRLGGSIRKYQADYRARSFRRKGTISFGADGGIAIRASMLRLFRKNLETEYLLGPQDIFNVRANGRLIRLEIVKPDGGHHLLILRARNRDEALHIASLLPGQMTTAFSAETAALTRFLEGLKQLTPHVWGTWTIVIVNVVVFLVMAANGGGFMKANPAVAIEFGSNFGPDTLSGEWWRLFTSTFIHFGFAHVAFNMIVLAQTGRIVERLYGNTRFIALYLFAGLIGSLLSLLWHPEVNSAGASGAIFGVLGAMLAYVLRYRRAIPPTIYANRLQMALWFIGYNLFNGFTHHGIDNGAHLGGLAGGLLMGWVLARPIEPELPRPTGWATIAQGSLVALLSFTALAWPLTHSHRSADAHEELHFVEVGQQEAVAEQKAIVDLRSMANFPDTPAGRAALAQKIRTALWPEWNQLYEHMNDAPLPPNSAQAPARNALLRYYDDMRKALLATQDVLSHDEMDHTQALAEIKSLFADAKRQRDLVQKMTAHP
jgi:rhomboid protease GluP